MNARAQNQVLPFAAALICCVAAAVSVADGPRPANRLPPGQPAVPGEIIVKFRQGKEMPPDTVSKLGGEVWKRRISGGELLVKLPPDSPGLKSKGGGAKWLETALHHLSSRPEVEYAHPNYVLFPTKTPNDPLFARQWNYATPAPAPGGVAQGGIGIPVAWDYHTGERRVVVAVVDTGIVADHPDIAGSENVVAGYDLISDPRQAADGDGRDSDATDPGDGVEAGECVWFGPAQPSSWHGTHVAGIVGAVGTGNKVGIAGINWQVTVVPVRVLGKCGGTAADIADGIRWAAGLPVPGLPPNTHRAHVINMSLGGRGRCDSVQAIQSAIDDATTAGAVIVVAAGNDAEDAAGFFPAGCRNVITVAASDARGHLAQGYSNFGEVVDVMAPGGDISRDDDQDDNPDGILSTVKGGYEYYEGTSMAAPHVAGVAALLLALDPALTPERLRARLQETARPRTQQECPRPCGAGLLAAPHP